MNIANGITLGAILLGLVSMISLLMGETTVAVVAFPLIVLLDRLDGMAARKFNCASELGVQLDTLADAINFGVLSLLMLFVFSGQSLWVAAAGMVYALCVVWRLARFNVQTAQVQTAQTPKTEEGASPYADGRTQAASGDAPSSIETPLGTEERYFTGLPSTNAAAWLFIACSGISLLPAPQPLYYAAAALILAPLLIANFRYSNRSLFTWVLYPLIPLAALGLLLL